jgi:hypothetical protein
MDMVHREAETQHLTPEELELWAEGLLPAGRAMHVADCAACRATAERERKMFLDLAQLPRFGPEFGFADRVMAKIRIPTPSGDFRI